MSDKILPATDAEIAEAREDFFGDDKRYLGVHSGLLYSLFARIEADRATIRAKDEEIERLRKVRTGSAVNRLHNLCDGFEEMDKRQEALISELVGVLGAVNGAIAFGLMAELRPYHAAWKGLSDSVTAALAKAKEAGQ